MLLNAPRRRDDRPESLPQPAEEATRPDGTGATRLGSELLMPAALAGLTIYLGFQAGGYFAGTTGWVTAALALTLAVRALAVGRPPRGLTWPLAWAAGALALFAVWTLASAGWSGSPSRALIEFDRVLLYLGVLLLFGTAAYPEHTLRRLPPAFVLAVVVLCGAGLFARMLPHQWPFAAPTPSSRMNWPMSYENALGALAGLGMVFALHMASWRREHPAMRVAGAAALPLLATALVLTFSRGGVAVAIVGCATYLLLCRSRGAFTSLIAAAPFTYLAAHTAFTTPDLATPSLTSSIAVDQGERVAATLALAIALTTLAMAGLLIVERRLTELPGPPALRRRAVRRGLAAALALVVAVVVVASGAPGDVYRKVVGNDSGSGSGSLHQRLVDPSSVTHSQNRPKYWDAALGAFADHPVDGTGAGTFGLRWERVRTVDENTTEGHSIYIETLGEMGLVGAILIVVVLGALVRPSFTRLRTPRRPLYAAVLAGSIGWLLHAGIDWDWEMPALTLWLFAMGGCALAASSKRVAPAVRPALRWRAITAAMCALVAVTPVVVALSQVRLDRSVRALTAGDCRTAESEALSSIAALDLRPEPHAVVAYCELRAGRPASAGAWMHAAHTRDPHNWQYVYGQAIVDASAGRDPRPALGAALRLDPLERFLLSERKAFSGTTPAAWKRESLTAELPLVKTAQKTGGR